MLKKFSIFITVVAVFALIALAYVSGRYVDKKEILRAQNEMQALKQQHVAIQEKVAALTQQKQSLNAEIDSKNLLIKENQEKIAKLERERSAEQLQVRKLRTEDQLENTFLQTYPQVSHAANVGISHITDTKTGISLPYLVVPAWFSETFISEHKAKETLTKELTHYQQNETLYGSVIDLKNKVLVLEEEKSTAYQNGYENAYARYEDINQKYVDLLKIPPKAQCKMPTKLALLGCSALGIAVGVSL